MLFIFQQPLNRIEPLENTIKIYLIQHNKKAAIPGRSALC